MKIPKTIETYDGVAAAINKEFAGTLGIKCNRFTLSRWRKGEQLPEGIEAFPPPDDHNRFDAKKCLAWVSRYIAARKSNPTKTLAEIEAKAEASARRERAKANREERADKKEAGDLIERSVAEIDTIGIIQRLHNACTLADEQEVPVFCATELKQLGVTVEIVAAFSAKLNLKMMEITARRVAMFQSATEEFLKGQA